MPKKNPFLKILRDHIRRPDYRSGNKSELARTLGVVSKDRAAFRDALNSLEESGELILGKKSRYRIPGEVTETADTSITGTISFSPNEKTHAGFFTPDPEIAASAPSLKGVEGDLYVPPRYCSTAMDGDRVAVKLSRKAAPKWHKHSKKHRDRKTRAPDGRNLEARIVKILQRKHFEIVGTYLKHGRYAHLQPDNSRLPDSFNLSTVLEGANHGDKIVAEFEGWDSQRVPPRARMTEVLGPPDAPGVDILSVIHRHGLPMEFPQSVLEEADAVPESIDSEEIERREDWRNREVFTIDPEDAKDFDDAISVERIPKGQGGGWELAVHIADVSHYVRPGSDLDKEAKKRGNSVYLADRVIPMLPEKLSNGVCSLKPDVERLTYAVIMRFTDDGKKKKARFVSAVIRSQRRFTYRQAFDLLDLDGKKPAPATSPEDQKIAKHVNRAWELASLLRKRRFAAGSLDLDFPEIRAILDEQGVPIDVRRIENDESHQLIEEFMLAANEAVALETKNTQSPSIYRIHEDPDPEKLLDFAEQARSYGYNPGDVTIKAELQKMLDQVRGKPEEHAMKIALLKSLKRAAYSAEPLGHYGLSKQNYTHFTSPIRRYADLIVHRVLRKLEHRAHSDRFPGKPASTPSQGQLISIAKHISETERAAADAEMETQRLKIIDYLIGLTKGDAARVFDGIVFDVRPIGAFVELTEFLIKGVVRKENLPSNQYHFDSTRQELSGRHGKFRLAAGMKVKVRVAKVDRVRGFIDFELVQ